jgi:uncharacterized protein YndB with AHSA1/START domain
VLPNVSCRQAGHCVEVSMRGAFQLKVGIPIAASASRVWDIIDDISLIPKYHPEVRRVDFISGKSRRGPGVRYRCVIPEGRKGTCVEEVVEYIPKRRLSTAMPEDSWGIDKMLSDFIVDTTVEPVDDFSCILEFAAYYNPVGLWNRILNILLLRRGFRKRSLSVMQGIKRLAEPR